MNVNIRYLQVFVSVYEHMSMSAAGEELFLSQPAVSRIIRELEETFDCRCFLRHSGRLHRTEGGEKLYLHAKQILAVAEQMEAAMQDQTRKRKVRVGATPTAGNYYLIDALARYQRECGELDVYLTTHSPAILENMVKGAELDFAVGDGMNSSQDIKVQPLFSDELSFVIAREAEAVPNPMPLLVLERGHANRLNFERELSEAGIDYVIKGQFADVEGIRKCARLGMGVGVLPIRAIRTDRKLRKLDMSQMNMHTEFSLALHRNKFVFPELQKLIDSLEWSMTQDG